MAKKTIIDDLLDIIQSIGFHLPLWAIFLVALVPTALVYFLTALLVSPLLNLQTNGPNLAAVLPLFTSFFAFVLSLAAGLGGWRARQNRRGLVEQTRSIDDLRNRSWREFELLIGEMYRRRK